MFSPASTLNVFVRGIIFDTVCLVWQVRCEEQGSFWIYDSLFVAEGIFWACVKCISSLGFLLALLLYRPPPAETCDEIDVKDAATLDISKVADDSKSVDNKAYDLSTYL